MEGHGKGWASRTDALRKAKRGDPTADKLWCSKDGCCGFLHQEFVQEHHVS